MIAWHGDAIVINIYLRQAMDWDILLDIPITASPPQAARFACWGHPKPQKLYDLSTS